MKRNIAVIGCGQLGRRHIQGLGVSEFEIDVHVYDVAKESLETCATFAKEIADDINNLRLLYFEDIETLSVATPIFDLVIISSTAKDRPTDLRTLTSLIKAKAWLLEKPICQSPEELIELIDLTKDEKVWINHFRRVVPWYRNMRVDYFGDQKININFVGPDIGIGCNVSHLIDLVNFLTGEIPVSSDTAGLSDQWHDAKRKGFKEIDGELICHFSAGSTMRVISDNKHNHFTIFGEIVETGNTFVIDEVNGTLTINGKISKLGQLPFQSQLTGKVFDQINQHGYSDLTPFSVAANCYQLVIEALLVHWQSTTGHADDSAVPLT